MNRPFTLSLSAAHLSDLCYTTIPVWEGFFDDKSRFEVLIDDNSEEVLNGTEKTSDEELERLFANPPHSHLTLHIFAEELGDCNLRSSLFHAYVNNSTDEKCWLISDMGTGNRICVVSKEVSND